MTPSDPKLVHLDAQIDILESVLGHLEMTVADTRLILVNARREREDLVGPPADASPDRWRSVSTCDLGLPEGDVEALERGGIDTIGNLYDFWHIGQGSIRRVPGIDAAAAERIASAYLRFMHRCHPREEERGLRGLIREREREAARVGRIHPFIERNRDGSSPSRLAKFRARSPLLLQGDPGAQDRLGRERPRRQAQAGMPPRNRGVEPACRAARHAPLSQ